MAATVIEKKDEFFIKFGLTIPWLCAIYASCMYFVAGMLGYQEPILFILNNCLEFNIAQTSTIFHSIILSGDALLILMTAVCLLAFPIVLEKALDAFEALLSIKARRYFSFFLASVVFSICFYFLAFDDVTSSEVRQQTAEAGDEMKNLIEGIFIFYGVGLSALWAASSILPVVKRHYVRAVMVFFTVMSVYYFPIYAYHLGDHYRNFFPDRIEKIGIACEK